MALLNYKGLDPEKDKPTELSPVVVYGRNDPAFKAYQDSLNLYQLTRKQSINDYKNAPVKGEDWKKYNYLLDIDASEHPDKYVKRGTIDGSMFSLDKWKEASDRLSNYDDNYNHLSKPINPFDAAMKWETRRIDEYEKYPYDEEDINGMTSKDRLRMHKSSLDTLKKQKLLSMSTGILPTHVQFPMESSFKFIYKKPNNPPVIPPVPKMNSLSNISPSQTLSKRKIVPIPKPQNYTDHNFYFGNALAWKDPNKEVGYYNLGDKHGRQSVTLRELMNMEPTSRKDFLDSFGNGYNDQYENAMKIYQEKNALK